MDETSRLPCGHEITRVGQRFEETVLGGVDVVFKAINGENAGFSRGFVMAVDDADGGKHPPYASLRERQIRARDPSASADFRAQIDHLASVRSSGHGAVLAGERLEDASI